MRLAEQGLADEGDLGTGSARLDGSAKACATGANDADSRTRKRVFQIGNQVPDQAASIEPAGFRSLVGAVRKIEAAMGEGKLGMISKEVEVAKKLRAHIPGFAQE